MQKSCYSYPVEFVEDVFGESSVLADLLKKATGSDEPKVLIVADMNVVQRTEGLGTKIGRYVQAHGIRLAGSPVVIAGGERINSTRKLLQMVYDSIQAGGAGLSIGRNVFDHPRRVALMKALNAIVHHNASVEEGMAIVGED